MPDSLHVRVFLSSPGDVEEERRLVRHLLKDDLPYHAFLRDRVTLDVVSWDDPAAQVPMLADLTPQESVNRDMPKPSACDIVIVVLWGRMGTPLPETIRKSNGESYLSGTEWEYEDALSSQRTPKPEVLLYRRAKEPSFRGGDPNLLEKQQQYLEVQKFFSRFRNSDGSLTGGFKHYTTPKELANKVKEDLLHLLAGRLAHAQANSRESSDEPGRRIVGTLPQGLSELFKDRVEITKQIKKLLLAPDTAKRAIVILGRSGIGKTAVACKILKAIEADVEHVDGLIYLGANSTNISFDAFYSASAVMFGREKRRTLESMEHHGIRQKINRLLEYFRDGHYIVLLDNLESLLRSDGQIADDSFRSLFECFLQADHGVRFLITSRQEICTSSDELMKFTFFVPLEALMVRDAAQLLSELFKGRELQVKADLEAIKLAAERARGIPKALEAIAGLLSRDPTRTLHSLLKDVRTFDAAVADAFSKIAYDQLSVGGRKVMEALAVFDGLVPEAAVSWLLQPYSEELDVHETLIQLWRGRFWSSPQESTLEETSRDLYGEGLLLNLHPIDREYSRAQISKDRLVSYNFYALNRRAASWYRQRRLPRERWFSITALEPQIREFNHLIRAEAYEEAASVLDEFDVDYLVWNGHAETARSMRLQLEGEIQDLRLLMLHERASGFASLVLGPTEDAISHLERMLHLAHQLQDLTAEIDARSSLGDAYRRTGSLEKAEQVLSDAYKICLERSDWLAGAECLFRLGLTLVYARRSREAIGHGLRMLELAELPDTVFRSISRIAYNLLALAHLYAGEPEHAKEYAQKALKEFSEEQALAEWKAGASSNPRGAPWNLYDPVPYIHNVLGMAYLALGQIESAREEFDRSIGVARKFHHIRPEGFALLNEARIERRIGDMSTALRLAQLSAEALEKLDPQTAAPASAFVAAIRASLLDDRRVEAVSLLDSAESMRGNPDLCDPLDLVQEAEELARAGGWQDLLTRAQQLAALYSTAQASF
jgi:tetratricopeptide (TPR) repeat protein